MARTVAKRNDTLRKLARKYGVSKQQLRELNPDVKFGRGKQTLGGETIRLGKGVGVPKWKAELLQDPKYASFLRNFDYDREKLNSDFIEMRNRQGRDLSRAETDFNTALDEGYRSIDESMDNRGLYRSGQRLIDRGRHNADINQQRQRFIDLQGEDREEARRSKREAIGGLKRQRMEERLAARERLTMRDANTEYGYG